ncbi:MAG: cysteine-rich CWC family protein [Bacteroidota bacterium]
MPKHEITPCPRCGKQFECKVGSVLLCQCSTVELTGVEREYLQELYDDCLCVSCIKELKAAFQKNQSNNTMNTL